MVDYNNSENASSLIGMLKGPHKFFIYRFTKR